MVGDSETILAVTNALPDYIHVPYVLGRCSLLKRDGISEKLWASR